jgi:hypothetical protein
VQGWRFQLSLFGNLVANLVQRVGDQARAESLAKIATNEMHFRDRVSLLDGLADLTAHSGSTQRFMPGIRMVRRGDVRHCQGTVLADWIAVDGDAKERMSGTKCLRVWRGRQNRFGDGLCQSVAGLPVVCPSVYEFITFVNATLNLSISSCVPIDTRT